MMKFKDVQVNTCEMVTALLTAVEEREGKNKNKFLVLSLSDGDTNLKANLWNCSKEEFSAQPGETLDIKLEARAYNGGTSYIVQSFVPSAADPADFVVSAPIPADKMFARIYKYAGGLELYAPLVQGILADNREKLLYWGAGKTVHHNIRGGLLYHVYMMMCTASHIAEVYKEDLDKNLLMAGVILHDIGKLTELTCDPIGAIDYTPDGNLFGHLFIGAEMIEKYAEKYNLPDMQKRLLKHMIVSHHGELEMGAIVKPAIPEADILNLVDRMDADMYMFREARKKTEVGAMSDKVFALDCSVYNPGSPDVTIENH